MNIVYIYETFCGNNFFATRNTNTTSNIFFISKKLKGVSKSEKCTRFCGVYLSQLKVAFDNENKNNSISPNLKRNLIKITTKHHIQNNVRAYA